jgi:hypothetical protein
MSLALHSTRHNRGLSAATGHTGRVSIASEIVCFVRRTILKTASLIKHTAQTFAEARMHRAMIEAEFYLNRYKHTSKNDDDLPIVGSAPADQPTPFVFPRVAWGRAAGAVVAITKRAYPIILVFAIFTTALTATIAIRLAIWLPLYLR